LDYATKNTLYSDAAVQEYWTVDPEKARTTVYHYEKDFAPAIFSFDHDIAVGICKDLEICISELLK